MTSNVRGHRHDARCPGSGIAAVASATLVGPLLAAGVVARTLRGRERRSRVVALLTDFLAEPMAATRRSAWAFLDAEGDAVRHFSHYVYADPDYGATETGFAALLRVLLFHRTVADLRACGELDERLYRELLEPHRAAWAGYTTRMAEVSATHPEAVERGDAALFTWRDA